MESSTILTADVLDILFEGRNKEYGAYELRRTYNRRLTVSITVMLSASCMLFIGFAFAGKKTAVDPVFAKDIELTAVKTPEKAKEPVVIVPPKRQAAPPVQVQTIRNTTIRVVADDQVREDEKPHEIKDMENVKIGTMNNDQGMSGDLVVAPPGDGVEKGVIELPKKDDEDANGPLVKVEIESEYPGGPTAWKRFLDRNLRFPQEALDNEVQGFVVVKFIVDREGNVSDVEAISGPQELRAEAIRVIKKSGKWTPAVQNGHHVKSYKRQPIGFQIASE